MRFDMMINIGYDVGMSKKESYLENTLRKAILDSDMNTMQLEKASGVSQSIISRFLNQERGITFSTASKIAYALDLELKPRGKKG